MSKNIQIMRRSIIILLSALSTSCTGIKHPEVAVYEQYNSMLDRCNIIGQATGEVYMGLNAVNNRSTQTIETRNAMRVKAKQIGGDALIPGDIARSDMLGNYEYTMTVLNCGQQKQRLKNSDYKLPAEHRLEELDKLLTKGVITEAEHKKARLEILSDI